MVVMNRIRLALIGMASTLLLTAAAGAAAEAVSVFPVTSAPSTSAANEADAAKLAAKLLDSPNVRPGLCVHVNCGDGKLTAALYMQGKYYVQGLDDNPANVAAARNYISSKSLYGKVVVDSFQPSRLPFADHTVNVLIVDNFSELQHKGLTLPEAMRIVTPYGTLILGGLP
jgi:SAM-dependent methyltransferase